MRRLEPEFYHQMVVYLLIFISGFIGLSFMIDGKLLSEDESVLYDSGVLVESGVWGAFMLVSSIFLAYGYIVKHYQIIRWSALVGFLLWLFACWSTILAGHLYIFVTVALLHTVFHAIVYLNAWLRKLNASRNGVTDNTQDSGS